MSTINGQAPRPGMAKIEALAKQRPRNPRRANMTVVIDQPIVMSAEMGSMLRCPGCGGENVHIDDHRVFDGSKSGENSSPDGNRGGWVAIPCWCETCPHLWTFVISVHKGNTFLNAVTMSREVDGGAW